MVKGGEHQTDTACSWLVCLSRGDCRGNTVQIVSTHAASPEARPPSFWGKPAVRPRSMAGGAPYSLRETLSPTQDQKPTLKTLTHTQSPTLTKLTSSLIQPLRTRPPPLSLVHTPPKTPTSVQPPLALPLHQPPHSLPTL